VCIATKWLKIGRSVFLNKSNAYIKLEIVNFLSDYLLQDILLHGFKHLALLILRIV